jgi:UPF0042 nucleotide-binding protein
MVRRSAQHELLPSTAMSGLHVVVVTGLSGAGRSTALHVLEDLGYFCVDNLPPALAPQLIGLVHSDPAIERLGFGVDVRTGTFLEGAGAVLDALAASGHDVEVIFLDCADAVLVRRFSETRRPHALAPGGDLLKAIGRERERLASLRARADQVFDTSHFSVHDLRRSMVDYVARRGATTGMVVRVVSFGFKYGLPVDADLVFDLRYLPNPHFVPELRVLPGTDPEVSRYVLASPETEDLLAQLVPLLTRTLPKYEREGKAYLTIALGCTGGRHRSVALAEELARRLGGVHRVVVAHRDIDRVKP